MEIKLAVESFFGDGWPRLARTGSGRLTRTPTDRGYGDDGARPVFCAFRRDEGVDLDGRRQFPCSRQGYQTDTMVLAAPLVRFEGNEAGFGDANNRSVEFRRAEAQRCGQVGGEGGRWEGLEGDPLLHGLLGQKSRSQRVRLGRPQRVGRGIGRRAETRGSLAGRCPARRTKTNGLAIPSLHVTVTLVEIKSRLWLHSLIPLLSS